MINENIKKRKSIRSFKADGIVTDEQIKELLEAAMLAPSACNQRPWEFIVVKSREKLNKIMEIHPYTGMLKTASCAIIMLANLDLKNEISDGFYPQDCGAATENILLQAVELGLGTCWCGLMQEPRRSQIKELFEPQRSNLQ